MNSKGGAIAIGHPLGASDARLIDAVRRHVGGIEPPRPEDIADAIADIVGKPRRLAVNEVLVRAGEQTW